MSTRGLDSARFERLALHGTGDDAWQAFVEALWPELARLVRANRSMGPLARSEDHVRDVVVRVFEKLGADDCRALRLYPAWKGATAGRTFADWLRIVSANVVRDFVREKVGRPLDPAREGPIANKRLVDSLAEMLPSDEELGTRPPLTAQHTVRELLAYARDHLPETQLEALGAWLIGDGFDGIAAGQGLASPEAANKLVRAALATLRRRVEPTD